MEISVRLAEETLFIKELHTKVQEVEQHEAQILTDRMRKNQPFLVAMLMSFEPKVNDEQFDYLLEMFCIIYLFFEEKTNIEKIAITDAMYDEKYETNLQFAEYLDGEENEENQLELGALNLENMHFKSLYTAMIFLSDESKCFENDEELQDGILLILKALIECLESYLLNE